MIENGHPRRRHQQRYAVVLKRLRAAREAADVTQIEVARRLHNTQTFVSKVERGERRLDVIDLIDYLEAIRGDPAAFIRDLLRELEK